jgi:hypothetical protein
LSHATGVRMPLVGDFDDDEMRLMLT